MNTAKQPDATLEHLTPSHRCLASSCSLKTPVTIISPDSGIVSKGVFQSMDVATVSVRLYPGNYPLLSEQFCCATFRYENCQSVFFTSILGVKEKLDRELVLAIPEQIIAEKRRAIRLPVPKESDFGVKLNHHDKIYRGEVVNINAHGALIDFGETLDIKLETSLQLELSLQMNKVLVPACPVRRESSRLGFSFEGHNGNDWKAGLQQMLKQIDRAWINKQSRVDKIPSPLIDLRHREPRLLPAD